MFMSSRLTQLREEKKYSQSELANLLGVHTSTVKKWEGCITSPNSSNLSLLAIMLGTSIDYLLGKTDNPSGTTKSEPVHEEPKHNACKLCGKETSNEYCHECYWKAKWPEHILNSPELERRRKRSHLTKLLSLDRDKPEAIFKASSSRNGTTYTTTLQSCTCIDFSKTRGAMPCKHILRLAGELGLFQSEHFTSEDTDYMLGNSPVSYESVREIELTNEVLENLKQELYSCPSISKAFNFFYKLNMKRTQLLEFADYLGADVHRYSDKASLTRQIVRLTVGEELYKAKAANSEDYTVIPNTSSGSFSHIDSIAQEIVSEKQLVPVTPEIKTDNRPSGFLKLLKLAACTLISMITIFFLVGAIANFNTGKEWLCFPAAFFIAGCLVMNTAKHKELQGSGFDWFLYGAFIPVISWIEVTMSGSQSKAKSFMKGLAISIIGILAFLAVFINFLPPVKAKEPAKIPAPEIKAENLAPAKISEDKAVPAPVIPDIKQESEQEAEAEEDIDEEAEERERQAEIKKQEQEYLREANAVVITPKGKKYHYKDCRTVRGKYTRLTIAQALKKGYKPCGVCTPPAKPVTEAPNLDFETY